MPRPSCPHPSRPRATTGKLSAPSRLEMRSKGNRRPCSCQIGGSPPGPTPNPPSSVFKEICQEGVRTPYFTYRHEGFLSLGRGGAGCPIPPPSGARTGSPPPRRRPGCRHGGFTDLPAADGQSGEGRDPKGNVQQHLSRLQPHLPRRGPEDPLPRIPAHPPCWESAPTPG